MRPKEDVPDLHTQISTLTSELELSTFLNKGILQSNSEYKLRITELERENAVLRAAERRLTATEDALESADKRCRELGKEVGMLERELDREREGRKRWEKGEEAWRGRWEGLKGVWGALSQGVEECLRDGSGVAETSARATRGQRKRQVGVGSAGRTVDTRNRSIELDEWESMSPVIPAPGMRKRRRVQATPTDEEEQESPTPPPSRRKTAVQQPKGKTPKESPQPKITPREKKAVPPSARKSKTAAVADQRKLSEEVMILKAEPISPAERYGRRQPPPQDNDSDEDPLAMD